MLGDIDDAVWFRYNEDIDVEKGRKISVEERVKERIYERSEKNI